MQNDNSNTNHLHEEVFDVKQQSQKLFQQNLAFVEKVTRIETQQELIKEQQGHIIKQFDDLKTNISKDIQDSVGSSLIGFQAIIDRQQNTEEELLKMQSRQGQQIDEIRQTLSEFTNIRSMVSNHEFRLKGLEDKAQTIEEIDKTRVQGRWALIAAIASGIISTLGVILSTFLK